MAKVKDALAVADAASWAVTVTLDVPAVVGVPEMTPLDALSDRPAGSPVAVQVYGAVPPEALSVNDTAVPTVPDWLPGLVTDNAPVPPVTMACEISHRPAPELLSLDQVPCSA